MKTRLGKCEITGREEVSCTLVGATADPQIRRLDIAKRIFLTVQY